MATDKRDEERQVLNVGVRDDLLDELLHLGNTGNSQVGLTIVVGGAVVSGELIKEIDYVKHIFGNMKWSDGELVVTDPENATQDLQEEPRFPHFIHLKEVRVMQDAAMQPRESEMLMRIRVSEIQAWSITSLG